MYETRNKKGWIVTLMCGLAGSSLSAYIPQFSMTLNLMEAKLAIPVTLLALSESVKTAFVVIAMLISGFVYEKLGLKKTFFICEMFLIIPQVIIPYNRSVQLLFLLKAVQGLSAIMFPMFIAVIVDWMNQKNVGFATSVYNGLFYGGSGIGGLVAGYAIPKWGFESSYWATALISVIVSGLWFLTVSENKQAAKAEKSLNSSVKLTKIAFSVKPWLLILSFLGTTWTVQALTVDVPIYAEFLQYTPENIAVLVSLVSVGTICACFTAGRVSDLLANKFTNKAQGRITVYMAGHLITIALFILFVISDKHDFFLLKLMVFLLSFGAAWGLGVFYSILPEIFGRGDLSFISGFVGGIGDLGMPISPIVVGVLFGLRGFWNSGFLTCVFVLAISTVCLGILYGLANEKQVKKPQIHSANGLKN